MPRRVRNPYGVVSIIPDDYPPELLRQLGLVEEPEEERAEGDARQEAERPQPQRRRRR